MKKRLFAIAVIMLILTAAIGCGGGYLENIEDLSDYDLVEEAYFGLGDDFEAFNDAQRVVYTVAEFDMEVQCGGLCQFFYNDCEEAPYVSQSLAEIGAAEYQRLYDDFIADNDIDISGLDEIEYEDMYDMYPFNDFDDDYYELYGRQPLETMLAAYIRAHIDEVRGVVNPS